MMFYENYTNEEKKIYSLYSITNSMKINVPGKFELSCPLICTLPRVMTKEIRKQPPTMMIKWWEGENKDNEDAYTVEMKRSDFDYYRNDFDYYYINRIDHIFSVFGTTTLDTIEECSPKNYLKYIKKFSYFRDNISKYPGFCCLNRNWSIIINNLQKGDIVYFSVFNIIQCYKPMPIFMVFDTEEITYCGKKCKDNIRQIAFEISKRLYHKFSTELSSTVIIMLDYIHTTIDHNIYNLIQSNGKTLLSDKLYDHPLDDLTKKIHIPIDDSVSFDYQKIMLTKLPFDPSFKSKYKN